MLSMSSNLMCLFLKMLLTVINLLLAEMLAGAKKSEVIIRIRVSDKTVIKATIWLKIATQIPNKRRVTTTVTTVE